jgi:pimeloyl-ACP methyl ester carboxylesterase
MDKLEQDARDFMAWVTTPPRHEPRRVAPSLANAKRTDVETSSGRVAAWRLGEGPAVILAHGWSSDNSSWERLISALAARGRAVVAVDHPGHGLSANAHCTRRSAGRALVEVAAKLGPISAAAGHSFGGPVVGMALSQGLPADRVVFMAPAEPRSVRWLRAAADKGIAPEIAKRAVAIAESEGEMFDMSVPGPHMRAHALFVQSKDDLAVPYSSTQGLNAAWSGSEIMLVDGFGHEKILEDEAIVNRVADFLAN